MRTLLLISALLGAGEPKPATVAIDFAPPADGPRWYADALEQLLAREMSRFHRVTLVDALDTSSCGDQAPSCVAALYKAGGVDVVVLGRLDGKTLHYEVHDGWSRGAAFDGDIAVSGANVTQSRVHQRASELVRRIIGSGGLLDKRPLAAAPKAVASVAQPARDFIALVAPALIALLVWPVLLLVLLRLPPRRQRPVGSWRWSALAVALLAAAWASATLGALNLAPLGAMLPLLGGLMWGAFVVLQVPVLLPPLAGLSRIRHDALGPTLRAWLCLCALRAALLASAWGAVLTLTLLAASAAKLDLQPALAVAFPGIGLVCIFWALSLADNLAAWLDDVLVVGPATARNLWHATARKYFMGYVRRQGVLLESGFIEHALFLPGRVEDGVGVVAYGGGLTHPRVLIGARARELALGDEPDEPEVPERTVNFEELPEGFLMPAEPEPELSRTGSFVRRLARGARLRLRAAHAGPRARARAPRLLGEPTTALGWVVPQPVNTAVPLISNTSADYEVVKSLLTEHYARFEKNLDEDEHDDTDPTQKDFLFGALMVAAGTFARGEHVLGTFSLALNQAQPRASLLSRAVMRGTRALYGWVFAWPAARVADAYAALNQALHPRLQHLHLEHGGSAEVLTARADAPKLLETSKTVLDALTRGVPTGADRQALKPTPRNRSLWLSELFHARLSGPDPRWARRLVLGGAAAALLVLVGAAVKQAVEYRPTYVERITHMQQLAAQAASPSGTGAPK